MAAPDTNGANVQVQPGDTLSKATLFTSLGVTGLKRFGGYIFEEVLPELSGGRWSLTIDEMRREPVLASALFAIEMLTRQVDWHVEPYEGKEGDETTDEDKKVADFCQSCLDDLSQGWEDLLAEVLTFLPFGWAYFEIVYKIRGGLTDPDGSLNEDPTTRSKYDDRKIGWRKISIRAQTTLDHWEFDPDGGIKGMWQMGPPTYQLTFIPIDKALLFRTRARKGSPEGESLFYAPYRPYYFKRNIENIEGIGIERDLAGLPVGKVPASLLDINASAAEVSLREKLKQIITRIRRDEEEGLLWPNDRDENGNPIYELELLGSPGKRQFDIDPVIKRKSAEMLSTLLADFIVLGHEQVGSYALGASKMELFTLALGAFLDAIGEVISEYGFTRLMVLNGMDASRRPTLKHGDITATDLNAVGAFLKNLADSGAPLFPNDDLIRWLFEQAHLPIPDDETLAKLEAMAPSMPAPGTPGGSAPPAGQPAPMDQGEAADAAASAPQEGSGGQGGAASAQAGAKAASGS